MILKRTALKVAAGILNKDANSVVQFNTDGTVGATNRKTVLVVDSVDDPRTRVLPLNKDALPENISIDKETAAEVLKNVPVDKTFKGLLEAFSVQKGKENEVIFQTTDGKRSRDIVLRKTWRALPDVKEVVGKTGKVICFNRKRLLLLLQAIDKNFTDTASGQAPVWLTICDDDATVLVSAEDPKTGLSAVGAIGTYDASKYPAPKIKRWAAKKKLLKRK